MWVESLDKGDSTMSTTNAANDPIAQSLTAASSGHVLVLATLRKKGTVRGKGADKKIYGDDTSEVLILTGLDYKALVEKSVAKLEALEATGGLIKALRIETLEFCGQDVEIADVCAAIQETRDSLRKTLGGNQPIDPMMGVDPSVWEPLRVNGIAVKGCRVYVGEGDINDPRSPAKGTIYLGGVKFGERILCPAPNGHWEAKSAAKTRAKNALRAMLPIGSWVSYALEPLNVLSMKVGAEASRIVNETGFPIREETMRAFSP
jgi:hypothetical protein